MRTIRHTHTAFDNTNQMRYHLPMTLNVYLIPHLEEFLHHTVTSGHHQSASEVVREAIRLMERVLRLNPSDAESTYQLGVLYARNGRTDEGVKMLRRAITLRANYPDPHYHIGRIALERHDHKTAVLELEEARRMLPNQEAIRLSLGQTYRALGREAEAKAEFAEVRRLKAAIIERDRQRVESDELMKPEPAKQ